MLPLPPCPPFLVCMPINPLCCSLWYVVLQLLLLSSLHSLLMVLVPDPLFPFPLFWVCLPLLTSSCPTWSVLLPLPLPPIFCGQLVSHASLPSIFCVHAHVLSLLSSMECCVAPVLLACPLWLACCACPRPLHLPSILHLHAPPPMVSLLPQTMPAFFLSPSPSPLTLRPQCACPCLLHSQVVLPQTCHPQWSACCPFLSLPTLPLFSVFMPLPPPSCPPWLGCCPCPPLPSPLFSMYMALPLPPALFGQLATPAHSPLPSVLCVRVLLLLSCLQMPIELPLSLLPALHG